MFNKRQFIDFFLVIIIASLVFLLGISETDAGLWEPWETSTMLAARQMSQSSILESTFWVPQLNGELIAEPYLQLWLLAAIFHFFPDPSIFLLRLPSSIVGIILVVMSFLAIRQASNRRAAWISTVVLLTLPMFILNGKLLHGDIWLIFAVSLPFLFYILCIYATTRRMQRGMASMTALSLTLSFLAGGLFALAIIACTAIIFTIFIWRHPHRKFVLRPFGSQYFLLSLYLSFVLSGTVFGVYLTHSRYALENRTPITLSELNDALDEDRVISIERRKTQIIGTVRPTGQTASKTVPFVLVESAENLNTNATIIFNLNETEKRTFENFLMWRFQKRTPQKSEQEVPPIEGALSSTLKFFWFHSNSEPENNLIQLGRIQKQVEILSADEVKSSLAKIIANENVSLFSNFTLYPGNLVKILNSTDNPQWIEIEDGAGHHGFISPGTVEMVKQNPQIPWRWWFDILFYGLFPWIAFVPLGIVCGLVSTKKLNLSETVFRGEFSFQQDTDVSEVRSPLQSLLLSWVLAATVAIIPSVIQQMHDVFVGLIPLAALLGIGIGMPGFWKTVKQSLEARILLIVLAIAALAACLYGMTGSPFRLVKYLLTDPMMHWNNLDADLDIRYILYFILAVILIFISLSGIEEIIQDRYQQWRDQRKSASGEQVQANINTSSSSSLAKVTRSEVIPLPVVPVFSLLLLGIISSVFIYYIYLPKVSDDFTETALINRYFELADQSEPVYLLTGENEQLCQSYKDCDPGYICQNARCHISTFASYSLNVAHPITQDEMIRKWKEHESSPAFYIIPKGTLYSLNQAYRNLFPENQREDLTVIDAPSSRLYLIGNHKDIESVNPISPKFPKELPSDASKWTLKLNDSIQIEGFRVDDLDFVYKKSLRLTLFYRILQPVKESEFFAFSLELKGRQRHFVQPMFNKYDEKLLLPGDLVADSMALEDSMMPSHGFLEIQIGLTADESVFPSLQSLTTIDF